MGENQFAMTFRKVPLVLCVTVLVLFFPSRNEGASSNKEEDSRSDCDHILPLMMMLGAPPTASLPSVWLLGMLSLGVMVFLGSGNFSNWRWSSAGMSEGREEQSEDNKMIGSTSELS